MTFAVDLYCLWFFVNEDINIAFALILSQQSLVGHQTPQTHSDLSVCLRSVSAVYFTNLSLSQQKATPSLTTVRCECLCVKERKREGGGKIEDTCETEGGDGWLLKWTVRIKRGGVVGHCRNKVTWSSFIKDQARLNKQHLETSNLLTAV